MFCWLDLVLTGIIAWGTVTGYLSGLKRVIVRLCVRFGSLLISLPFASNCAVYLRPALEEVFRADLHPAMPASIICGPWGEVLAIHAVSADQLAQRLVQLAVNISALCFLTLALLIVFRLLEKPCHTAYKSYGSLAGFASGVILVICFLAIAPVLLLGKGGVLLAAALEESWLAALFSPFVQAIVNFVAPFVL